VRVVVLALLSISTAWGQQAAPEPEPAPVADEPLIEGPAVVEYVEAAYPQEALEAGLEAVVTLRIELDAEGDLVSVDIVTPAGNGFDEAAVDAVLEMTFAPARAASGPVSVMFDFDYGFVLQPEPEPAVELPITLDGTVREMGTRTPIAGVSVVVVGTDLVGTTDHDGRFGIRGVPPGSYTLRLLHTGHISAEVEAEVTEGEVTTAAMWMRSEAYRDNEVVAVYQTDKVEVTRRTLSIEEIRRVPGTFGDPVKVIQTLPGAARTPFGTGFLVIRGSNPEDSGVYIDGVRIPIIYHLTGTTSVIQPELVESVDYLPGGYGVQFGRSMGGTVDVKTRDEFSEQGRLIWGTDILDSQLYYEGRLGKNKKHGLAIGARRSYVDAFIPLFTGDTGFAIKPRYWDYQVKWAPDLGADRLSVFVYGFDDLLEIGTPDDVAQGSDQDTQGDLRTKYNSHRIIVNYQHPISDTLTLAITPSLGVDGTFFGLGGDFVLDGDTWIGQVRAELPWAPTPHVEVIPGLDFIGSVYGFDFKSALSFSAIDDPLAEREPVGFDGRGTLWSPDLFLKANLRPMSDPGRWLVTPGVRVNLVTLTSAGSITGDQASPAVTSITADPRLATRYAATGAVSLKAVTGLYHQPPQPQELIGVGTQTDVRPETSWASSVGWEHRITPSIFYDVDVFYKYMNDLIVFNEDWGGFGENPFVNEGQGRAYGLEVIARHDPTGRFFGWISYTLSRSRRLDPPDCDEPLRVGTYSQRLLGTGSCWYAFDFDQTHILSAQAGYDLPRDFGVSAQVQFVTGNPTSEFNAGVYDADGDFYNGFRIGDPNEDRLPPFFQTSLRFDKLWTFKTWQLESYVDLINAIRGVNPEFTLYNYDFTESAYVRGLPFIPNLGIEAKFWL
jgi:TonB family protein